MYKFHYVKYHKTFKLADDQFLLLAQINNLGFVIRSQIDMLYSLIKGKKTLFSVNALYKLINQEHLLESISIKQNSLGQKAYVVSAIGRAFLKHYHCLVRNPRSFKINGHNLQANETLIQALYSAAFKPMALGKNNISLAVNSSQTQAQTVLGQGIVLPKFQLIADDLRDAPAISTRINQDIFKDWSNNSGKAEAINEALLISGAIAQKTVQSLTALGAKSSQTASKDNSDDFFENFVEPIKTLDRRRLETGGWSVLETLRQLTGNLPETGKYGAKISNFVLANYLPVAGNLPVTYRKLLQIWQKIKNVPIIYRQLTGNLPETGKYILKISNSVPTIYPKLVSTAQKAIFPVLNPALAGMQLESISAADNSFDFQQPADNPALIYKPIGLLPFKADYDLSSQINQTYAMQQKVKNNFNIKDYDIRPFNAQYGLRRTVKSRVTNMPFEADTMISFKRGNQICRVFIELDNRTEGLSTPVQKAANYIYYALQHPKEDILLAFVATDGSLPSKKINGFQYPNRHLGMMADKILRAKVGEDRVFPDGTIQPAPNMVHNLYNRCPNLKIIFAGVSEAPLRIAEFIINANHNSEYYLSAVNLAKYLSQHTTWSVEFQPIGSLKYALNNPNAFLDTGYNKFHYNIPKIFGYYHYVNGSFKCIQQVIAGDEYDLDTQDAILQSIKNFNKDQPIPNDSMIPPMVIYPVRERKTHALTLPVITKYCNWNKDFIAGQVYYYQPQLGIDNNPYLLFELRQLLQQYAKYVQNYFLTGYLTKKDDRNSVDYGSNYLKTAHPSLVKPKRSFQELRALASQLSAKEFAQQLMLTELPLGAFQELIQRCQGRAFAAPVIAELPYSPDGYVPKVPQHIKLTDCLYTPNSVKAEKRRHIAITNY